MTEGVTVIFNEDGVCALSKPAGMAMHTGTGVEDEAVTLVGWARASLPIEKGFDGPSFLGRLDRPTSGLVLGALSREGLRAVEPAWSSGLVEKAYLALVHGRCEEGGVIEIPLAARRARHRGSGRIEEAITRFWSLTRPSKRESAGGRGGVSLVLVFLDTGRTHQIRRHMKAIGHPVVGDARYGDARRDASVGIRASGESGTSLMLHCWRFRTSSLPPLPEALHAPAPERMRALCERLDVDLEGALSRAETLSPPTLSS